jgi:hypothetical protein
MLQDLLAEGRPLLTDGATGANLFAMGLASGVEVYAGLAVVFRARISGGCCGARPAHVAAMRRGLDAGAARPRPSLKAIVAALGPLVAPAAVHPGGRARRERA